jgi:hypothetical protein
MILRADHVAGGIAIAAALAVLAVSGDLPLGTLAFPGAGMLPKLVCVLMILFGVLLIARAGQSAPFAEISWSDLPHAVRVLGIPRRRLRLHHARLRHHHDAAAIRADRAGGAQPRRRRRLQSRHQPFDPRPVHAGLKTPLEQGLLGSNSAEGTLDSLPLGFPHRAAAGRAVVRIRLRRRHAGRRAAGDRALIGHQHSVAGHLRPRRHQGDRDAGRHLLWPQYGGSTTSILMRIPGEASSVMTCIDGMPWRKGRAGAAPMHRRGRLSVDRRHLGVLMLTV